MRVQLVSLLGSMLLACGAGGDGKASIGDPPGGMGGGPGSKVPALVPGFSIPSVDVDASPPGDTGGPIDTGGPTDTGGSGDTSGGDLCSQPSKCTADPPLTTTQIDTCRKASTTGTCPVEYKALLQCTTDNRVCTTANRTDATATMAACKTEQTAYTTCTGG